MDLILSTPERPESIDAPFFHSPMEKHLPLPPERHFFSPPRFSLPPSPTQDNPHPFPPNERDTLHQLSPSNILPFLPKAFSPPPVIIPLSIEAQMLLFLRKNNKAGSLHLPVFSAPWRNSSPPHSPKERPVSLSRNATVREPQNPLPSLLSPLLLRPIYFSPKPSPLPRLYCCLSARTPKHDLFYAPFVFPSLRKPLHFSLPVPTVLL